MSVDYERRDGVAIVTIMRPEKKNAMDLSVFEGLAEAAARAASDEDVRAVLVRGAGGAFSSGIDLGFLGSQLADGGFDPADGARLQASFTAFEEIDKPVVAGIEGPCFGAGLQLALACHLRLVAPTASLSVMEVRWALVPDLGGTYRLPRLVGLGRATELVLSGRRVGAEEAVAIGLAERTIADTDDALDLATQLAAAPGAVKRVPRLLRENLGRGRDEALEHELSAQLACISGDDFGEAVRAHLEQREPTYSGT